MHSARRSPNELHGMSQALTWSIIRFVETQWGAGMRGVRKTELFVAGVFGVASGYVIWKPLLDEHLLPQLQKKSDPEAASSEGGSARDASAVSRARQEK